MTSTLAALHKEVFDECYGDGEMFGSLEELWNDEEFMNECGSHTILDAFKLVETSGQPDYNTLRPLAPERMRHWFGTEIPTYTQFTELWHGQRQAERELKGEAWFNRPKTLDDECKMRWSGLYVVLHENDLPSHIAFWGYSGD